ncbi:LptF/LptG family permease [Cerasicoccus arenae]|uniref:LptF/LptG family permease n=1 Tax=Cerasicoccus arenae TaxID=424488 RepID=UPI00167B23FE|nr:LptF/LptG family permease [Cerasicoccus arenae]MBK1859087.1 LptF/LptG family permease [Cerasicoccus arenae]
MRLLDRYVFFEWLKAFAMAVAAMLGVLLLEDFQDDMQDYLDWGATGVELVKYYLYLTPSFLPLILPIGLLISILFTLGNLHRNNEITAMRASGLHLFTITRSLWLAGGVLALLLLLLNASVVPHSIEQSRLIRNGWRMQHEAEIFGARMVGIVPLMSFDNQQDRRLWFMNRFSEYSYDGFGVNVYERDEQGREVRRIMGQEAYFDDVDGYWVFVQGREMLFDPESGENYRSIGFKERAFPELEENPWLMQALNTEPDNLSFNEIQRLLTMSHPDNPKLPTYEIRRQRIVSQPFVCLVMVGIAIPFAVAGVRVNPVVGVAKALGFFALFFMLEEIFRLLGSQGIIPLAVAVWLPFGLMLLLSAYFFRKVV